MFPSAQEVLKAKEGAVAQAPLPLLLHALVVEERTCTLELKVRGLEKRIVFEDGSPMTCTSNLLHETLGKFLVEKGKLDETQYHQNLAEAAQAGLSMGEHLVKKGLVTPFDLYKQLQANLALKILDCFRWVDARYRILREVEVGESAVKMNPLQLILTGVSSFLPLDVVTSGLNVAESQRFALHPKPPHELTALKLSPKEARLVQGLRHRPTLVELVQKTQLDTEEVLRRVYALAVMGFVDLAERVLEAAPREAKKVEPVPTEPPPQAVPPAGLELKFLDDDEAARNALLSAFMEHRNKDPFDLLGVPEDPQPQALRKAFLGLVDRYAPLKAKSAETREKAETLVLAYARAFAALADPEQHSLWKKRRQVALEAKVGKNRPSTEEQMRISTKLLDAGAQFGEGKKRLEAGNARGALEYFQYACDIEPRGKYLAHLAWARYQANPKAHAKLALQELAETARKDPKCEEAHFFAGEIFRLEGQVELAAERYKRAYQVNPNERRYADLAHEMARAAKARGR